MQVSEILEMKKGIKAKLMAATSLLLVSAILLSLTTYAWFILSTAPEVTEMQTTAGANGSLEIALQSGDTAVSEIKNRVGDSSAVGSLKDANSTWGNVVDLSGNIYGLQGLSLLPARLNMNADGTVSKRSPLKMPLFGQDGRISELANLNSMRYDDGKKEYVAGQDKHGVLVYADDESINNGTKDEKHLDRQGLINTTRQQIQELRTSLRKDLVQTMEDNQEGISSILYHTVYLSANGDGSGSGGITPSVNGAYYDVRDYNCILGLLSSFSAIQAKSAKSVRHALLACAAADMTNYPTDNDHISKKLSDLYAKFLTLPIGSKSSDEGETEKTVYAIAAENKAELEKQNPKNEELIKAYSSVMSAADATTDVQVRILKAQAGLSQARIIELANIGRDFTEAEKIEFSQKISNSILFNLFNVESAQNRGIYVTDETDQKNLPRTLFVEMRGDSKYYKGSPNEIKNVQSRFYMLKDSGLFSSLATLAGDFESESIKWKRKTGWTTQYFVTQIRASTAARPTADNLPWGYDFGYSPKTNTGCLQAVYNATSGLKADGSVKYVITSAEKVNAYGYTIDLAFRSSESGNLFLQQKAIDRVTGKDSDTPEGRLPSTSTTQGNGSTVEFLLQKSAYYWQDDFETTNQRARDIAKCLRVVFLVDNGEWSILCVAMVDYDNIDITNLDVNDTVKITGPLKLYSATRSASGGLTLSDKTDLSITDLTQDTPKAITALVYLDGDEVQNAYLTPDQPFTLSGSINLQFATDAQNLKPMEYTDFIVPKTEKSKDEEEGSGQ